jgi:type II secretory pathway pseudopilin PulG
MKRASGYTLTEILILIALIGIFSAGFLSFFSGMLRTERQARFTIKTEADVSALRTFLKKELQGIGFGISADYLKTNPGGCSASAVISGNNTALCYLSLASRQTRWAGCWWMVDSSGNAFTNATSRFGGLCPALNRTSGSCVFLDNNRLIKGNGVSRCTNTSQAPSSIVFYLDSRTPSYPSDFLVKLFMSTTSTPDKSCHPDLQRSTLQLETKDNNQPVISCVLDFRIRYIDKSGNPLIRPPSSFQDLAGIRVCLIVQAGGRGTIRYQSSLTYSERCGGDTITLSGDYRFYPFKVIEEEVSLPNLRGWGL